MLRLLHYIKPYQVFTGLLILNLVAISWQFKTHAGEAVFKNWFFRLATPLGDALGDTLEAVGDGLTSFATIRRLKAENTRLSRDLDGMKFERSVIRNQLARANKLEEMLRVLTAYSPEGTVAEITTRSFQVWDKSVIIRGGLKNGFTPELPVLDVNGVVGRTVQCSPYYSEVALLTNAGFAMAGYIPEKDIRGVVHGTGGPQLTLDYVHIASKVDIGDWVLSSGDDGIFPMGFPVGVVVEVAQTGQYFQDIRIQPAVDIYHQRYVFVMKRTVDQTP